MFLLKHCDLNRPDEILALLIFFTGGPLPPLVLPPSHTSMSIITATKKYKLSVPMKLSLFIFILSEACRVEHVMCSDNCYLKNITLEYSLSGLNVYSITEFTQLG